MAVKGYECEGRESWEEGVDFSALDAESDEKVLLRVVTEPKSRSGIIGVDVVRQMIEAIEREENDKGVLVGDRFSEAARREIYQKGLQMVSDRSGPSYRPRRLYLTIQECVDDLCRARCGQVPENESQCKGRTAEGYYDCRIRLISDNAWFHCELGWANLLKADLLRLLTFKRSLNGQGGVE